MCIVCVYAYLLAYSFKVIGSNYIRKFQGYAYTFYIDPFEEILTNFRQKRMCFFHICHAAQSTKLFKLLYFYSLAKLTASFITLKKVFLA